MSDRKNIKGNYLSGIWTICNKFCEICYLRTRALLIYRPYGTYLDYQGRIDFYKYAVPCTGRLITGSKSRPPRLDLKYSFDPLDIFYEKRPGIPYLSERFFQEFLIFFF